MLFGGAVPADDMRVKWLCEMNLGGCEEGRDGYLTKTAKRNARQGRMSWEMFEPRANKNFNYRQNITQHYAKSQIYFETDGKNVGGLFPVVMLIGNN